MPEVAGPLGRVLAIATDRDGRNPRLADPLPTANAQLMLRRCAVVESDQRQGGPGGTVPSLVKEPTLRWAAGTNLGQGTPQQPNSLLEAVRRRRHAALRSLDRAGLTVRAARLVPEAALLTGTGEAGVQDVGLALHGTYGWPAVRGGTLKGVAHAYARCHHDPPIPPERLEKLFGAPRPGANTAEADAARGEVTFLDAVPYNVLPVSVHVMTPHAGPYYEDPKPGSPRTPPAEYHNPVPVPFLAVEGHQADGDTPAECALFVALVGSRDEVTQAAELLLAAAEQIGVGGKTTAGYGYLRRAAGAAR